MRAFSISVFWMICLLLSLQVQGQYQVNGNASQTACNCYQLTPDQNAQSGSVWNVNLIDLNDPFNFTFDVFLGCNDGGADGIAFVLQPLSVNAGSAGGGIGYAGISPSLAVEMDTYQNSSDPSYDHIAIQSNGSTTHGGGNNLAGPVQTSASSGNVEDCAWHTLHVVWDPATLTMTVYFDGVLRLTYTGDIVNNLFGGNPNVYWGFTGATGGATNLQQFCNTLNPAFIIASPLQCVGVPVDFESASAVATQITGYDWDFGDGNTGTGGQTSHIYATAGNFTVTLTITSEGCTESSTEQVTVNPSPDASVGPDLAICTGGSIQLSPVNLTPGGSYQWSPATGLSNTGVATPDANPTNTTTYTLTVTSGAGCVASDNLELVVNPLPTSNAGPDQTICTGDATPMAGSGGVSYQWNPAADLVNATDPTTNASPTALTNYVLTVTDANGCQDTDDMTIFVNPLPVVDAGVDDSMCNEQTVQLSASGAATYVWSPATDLDDATIANPIFSGSSTSTLTVTGTDANGCVNTDDVTITVFPLPVAAFTDPADACLGTPSSFANNSTGNGLTYAWNFGDASAIDASTDPVYIYASVNTFNVNLLVTDANGCQDNVDGSSTVLPLPVADAGPDQTICIGNATPMAGAGGVSYQWNPATDLVSATDPTTNASPTVQTNYVLTVTDANGCQDTDEMTISINPLPIVDAGVDDSMCDEQSVQLSASGAATYVWSPANDLDNASVANPTFSGSSTSTLTVTGTDANGCVNTDDVTITVFALPVAAFTDPADACLGNPSTFINNSTGNGLIYAWNFGDASVIDASTDPAYIYGSVNTFNVNLLVTDINGCQNDVDGTATVLPLPVADMNLSDGAGFCENEDIQFVDESTGGIASVVWSFGDFANVPAIPNTTSTLSDPVFAYSSFGPYTVALYVTSTAGCTDNTSTQIIIYDNPVADFSFDIACEGDATNFTDGSSVLASVVDTWQWDFGNGVGTSTVQDPAFDYGIAGVYTVSLAVETNDGCVNDVSHDVWVNPTPIISISGLDTCLEGVSHFSNNSSPQDNTIASWDWDFGDAQTASGLDQTHTYLDHGQFTVTLTATTDSGCVASGQTSVKVYPNPEPLFDMIEAEGCTPHQVQFINQSAIATGFIGQYDWDFGNGNTATTSSPNTTYIDSGYYDVTLSATSTDGCNTVLFVDDAVRANITPVADFDMSDDLLSLLDAKLKLTDRSLHALEWDWSLGDGTLSSTQNPVHRYENEGIYDIRLTAINGDCEDTKWGQVVVEPIFTFYVPSSFSPNADGINDEFYGIGEGYTDYTMRIYNRWDEVIFESNSDDFGWDGTYKGKQVEAGAYVYRAFVTDWRNEAHQYVGQVILLR